VLYRAAGDALPADPRRAADLLQQALAIDDQFAEAWYLLGRVCDTLAAPDRAREAYLRAKDLDICPLRILEPMNQAVLDAARHTGTPLVDVRKLFEAESRDRIPGGYFMLDHVHPSIAGHRRIADALLDELARQRIVSPREGWQADRDRKAREHLASLSDLYFARGRDRLESLRRWTQGRVDRVHSNTRDAGGPQAADGP
jgi:lysophospholipase L1-like esterase